MNWYRRRRLAHIFRHSLCATPVACMAAALLAAPSIRWIDDQTRWTLMGFGPDGARALLAALGSSLLTFLVFAFSILLLAVQIAGGRHRSLAETGGHPNLAVITIPAGERQAQLDQGLIENAPGVWHPKLLFFS